jgi:hypothetical protein
MEEIPMMSAFLSSSQSGSAISSIKAFETYPFSLRMVARRMVPRRGRGVLL